MERICEPHECFTDNLIGDFNDVFVDEKAIKPTPIRNEFTRQYYTVHQSYRIVFSMF